MKNASDLREHAVIEPDTSLAAEEWDFTARELLIEAADSVEEWERRANSMQAYIFQCAMLRQSLNPQRLREIIEGS